MIWALGDTVLREGYNYDYPCTVVEAQKRKSGKLRTFVYIPSGPIINGNGKLFDELCTEYGVTEIKEKACSIVGHVMV